MQRGSVPQVWDHCLISHVFKRERDRTGTERGSNIVTNSVCLLLPLFSHRVLGDRALSSPTLQKDGFPSITVINTMAKIQLKGGKTLLGLHFQVIVNAEGGQCCNSRQAYLLSQAAFSRNSRHSQEVCSRSRNRCCLLAGWLTDAHLAGFCRLLRTACPRNRAAHDRPLH